MLRHNKKGFVNIILALVITAASLFAGATLVHKHDTMIVNKTINKDEMMNLLQNYTNHSLYNFYYIYLNESGLLNKTYIDNNYYNTYNYYNETIFNELLNKLEYLYNYIFSKQNSLIDLRNKTKLNLTGCNEIDFLFKNAFINAIFDNKGLKVSSSLPTVSNINFVSSFFVNINNEVITHNFDLDFDQIDTNKKAIKVNTKPLVIFTDNDINLTSGEIIINFMFDDDYITNSYNAILEIYKNDTSFLTLYSYRGYLYLRDDKDNVQARVNINSIGFSQNHFGILKLEFYNNKIDLVNNNNVILIELDANPLNGFNDKFKFKSYLSNNYDNYYFRSLYINTLRMIKKPATYEINDNNISYNNFRWHKFKLMKNYNTNVIMIDNNIYTEDNNTNYWLYINLNKTSLANIYCYK